MGLNWSKDRNRKLAANSSRVAYDEAMEFAEPFDPGPSKAALRVMAQNAIASYRGPVKQLPSYVSLKCRSCGHRGVARVPFGKSPRFRCAGCGSSLVAKQV